ncbi:pimeloyl-ACP methyl ester esterase BioH [Methylophaga sulfidovorans]|uniref:Pimeloyl-[acyl-carrier protein] methyl ester esterase n=1 Tax=Methylophaga sulfidovorans TaxID=45496 RepID=A0A1I3TUB5_9GAMM|nr:pimeloyl-ACP methyl ester esterase BioH [Methylophaga sulfidovorans]SFJ74232.1 pimeloyl-[acyl-carrier protein] methyl ester esterase [Methylophaga sulfidovorans]
MHINSIGQGSDLVLVHGWSMHSSVWSPLLELLSEHFRCHLVDLPGHGQSDWHEGDFELSILLAKLAEALPEKAIWLGWSLGGQVSLAMAKHYPDKVKKLIMLAANPCFVQTDDWPCAMPPEVFETFSASLAEDQQQTLQRFIMLQAKGANQPRQVIKQLSEQLAQQHEPHPQALQAGLECLANWDFRDALKTVECPVQLILAENDHLIPVSLVEYVQKLQPKLRIDVMTGLGHAPFISQPQQCQLVIEQFIHE